MARTRPVFITFNTKHRWELPLASRDVVLAACVADHGRRYELHGAVVMPDHVHLVLSPRFDDERNSYGLGEIVAGIKGASSHAVNRLLARSGSVWQREWYDRLLRSGESARAAVKYVCANPVRAGLCAREDEYRWLWREWIDGAAEL